MVDSNERAELDETAVNYEVVATLDIFVKVTFDTDDTHPVYGILHDRCETLDSIEDYSVVARELAKEFGLDVEIMATCPTCENQIGEDWKHILPCYESSTKKSNVPSLENTEK